MLKDRKKPTEHREGKLVNLVDLLQRLTSIRFEEGYYVVDGDGDFHYNQKYADEVDSILKELHDFDITEIGNLYLTSGGRVVLDKGYGECFNDSDTVIFTLDELKCGMNYDTFKKRIDKLKDKEK